MGIETAGAGGYAEDDLLPLSALQHLLFSSAIHHVA